MTEVPDAVHRLGRALAGADPPRRGGGLPPRPAFPAARLAQAFLRVRLDPVLRRRGRRRHRAVPDGRDRDDHRRGCHQPRPPRRARAGAHRRLGPSGSRRLLRLRPPRADGRVLHAPSDRGGRDVLLRRRQQPDDDVPRARMVLDLALHPLRDRDRGACVARGRAQVPHRRELRLGDPPLRKRVRLRGHRRDRLRGHRRRLGRRRPALPRHRARHDHRRARVQGLGGAVPHVDARRLPGRAHARDRVHVRGDEDRRSRPDHAPARDRVPLARRTSGRSRSR